MASMSCFPGVPSPKELSIFTAVASTLLGLVTTVGNGLIIIAITKDPLNCLHTPFNYFLVNLAASDMIVGMLSFPISAYTHALESMGEVNNVIGKVLHLSLFISATSSLLGLIALSVDRYVAISFPIKYRIYLSWFRCYVISVTIWGISISIPFLYLTVGYVKYLFIYTNCGLLLCLVIMLVIYNRVRKILQRNAKRLKVCDPTFKDAMDMIANRSKRDRKVTRTFLIVIGLFISTMIPVVVMVYILHYCHTCSCLLKHILRDLTYMVIALNSCLNPFVYTIRHENFRKSIRALFLKSIKVTKNVPERPRIGSDSLTPSVSISRTYCKSCPSERKIYDNTKSMDDARLFFSTAKPLSHIPSTNHLAGQLRNSRVYPKEYYKNIIQ